MRLLNIFKNIYKKILYGYKGSSKSYKKYLIKKGITIGKNVTFYEPYTNYIDTQKPFLITIGDNVEITRGVTIITHDYSWCLFKQMTGEIIGSRGEVIIGNNVFIGMNTLILKGVHIGNNVIIGAGSIVCKDIPDNCVVAGSPAKIIYDIQTFYNKRKKEYVKEAINMFKIYYNKYNKVPNKETFDEFFWLFEERNNIESKKENNKISKKFSEKMYLTGNYDITYDKFINSKPLFNGYNEFIDYCMSLNIFKEDEH